MVKGHLTGCGIDGFLTSRSFVLIKTFVLEVVVLKLIVVVVVCIMTKDVHYLSFKRYFQPFSSSCTRHTSAHTLYSVAAGCIVN